MRASVVQLLPPSVVTAAMTSVLLSSCFCWSAVRTSSSSTAPSGESVVTLSVSRTQAATEKLLSPAREGDMSP